MEEKKIYDLWLDSLWEFAPKKKHLLIENYKDSFGVWKNGRADIQEGMKSGVQENDRMRTIDEAKELRQRLEDLGITALAWDDPEFPKQLREIPNPPWMIYVWGRRELLYAPCVAVVGARKASEYGKNVACAMGKRLAASEAVVVSGMALGIDAWAHRGALDARSQWGQRGGTIAVLGNGVNVCYPAANRKLYGELRQAGVLVSEFLPDVRPRNYYFPMRNRIISGLSRAVVIVEAAVGSGSLITAELAVDQGREVFAVPGNIDRIGSLGTNKLIKDGAFILISVEDLIEELGLTGGAMSSTEEEVKLGEDETRIITILLREGEVTADRLRSETGLSISRINGLVSILEMKGILSTAIGKIFLAKKFENLYNTPL